MVLSGKGSGGGEFDIDYQSVQVSPRGQTTISPSVRTKILFVDDSSNIKILSPGSGGASFGSVTITLSESDGSATIISYSQDTEYFNLFFLGTK